MMPNGFKSRWVTIPNLLLLAVGLLLPCAIRAQSTTAPEEQTTVQGQKDGAWNGQSVTGEKGAGGRMMRRRAERRQMLQLRVLERISQMAPEDRERMLSRLPEARRKRVEQGLRRLEAMTPEQRQRLTNQLRRFRQMTPAQQQRLRALTRELASLPSDRRTAVRQEFQRLQRMTDEQQLERTESADFQNQFTEAERRLLLDLTENAPPPPARGRSGAGGSGSSPR